MPLYTLMVRTKDWTWRLEGFPYPCAGFVQWGDWLSSVVASPDGRPVFSILLRLEIREKRPWYMHADARGMKAFHDATTASLFCVFFFFFFFFFFFLVHMHCSQELRGGGNMISLRGDLAADPEHETIAFRAKISGFSSSFVHGYHTCPKILFSEDRSPSALEWTPLFFPFAAACKSFNYKKFLC